jgi:SAM-dependent methyltransferase
MTEVYAPSRTITEIGDCYFYHTIDLPGHGVIKGEWDLRTGVDSYLGHIQLSGKRVLEIGTANGFLCFEMEKRGAEVIAYDLSENDEWDIVPYGGKPSDKILKERKNLIRKINNAWWLTHRLLNSKARVVYGSVYNLPKEIGPVDITTFGSVLLHLRDPFLSLQKAAEMTRETLVVTEVVPVFQRTGFLSIVRSIARLDQRISTFLIPSLNFLPNPDLGEPWDTWWNLSPELVARFLKILGFSKLNVSYHNQIHHYGKQLERSRSRQMFTVIGQRN